MSGSYSNYSSISVRGRIQSTKQGTVIGTVTVEPGATGGLVASECSGITVMYNGKFYKSDGTSWSVISVGEDNVQADWNQTDDSKDDFIKNKPTIPSIPNISVVDNGTGTYVTDVTASGHAITLSRGSVTIPDVSIVNGTNVSGNVITALEVDSTDKHKIKITKGITALTSETQLSKGTTSGSGNAVTDISVNGHQITLSKDKTFVETSAIGDAAAKGVDSSEFALTSTSTKLPTTAAVAATIKTAVSSVYRYKDSKTVSQINALGTGATTGDVYNVTDSGTLTQGSVAVLAGDNVAWNGSAWDKLAATVNLSSYVTLTGSESLTNKTINGYTPGAAMAKGVDTSISSASTDNNVPTSAAVYSAINDVITTIFGGSY